MYFDNSCLIIVRKRQHEVSLITKQTRMRSRCGTLTNPHAQVFDSPAPQVPPQGHDLGHRMKILINMFYTFYLLEHKQSLVYMPEEK